MIAGSGDALVARVAWWMSVVMLVLIAILVMWILNLRGRNAAVQQRHDGLRETWRTLLARAIDDVPVELPAVSAEDAGAFLLLWTHLQESVRAEAKNRLNEVARRVGMDAMARRLAHEGDVRERLIGLTALGHLRDESMWDDLLALSLDRDPAISMAAAKALFRIDAPRAAHMLVPMMLTRDDWPRALVASMLEEAGADVISKPLADAVAAAAPDRAPRIIRFLELAHSEVAVPVVRRMIQKSDHPDVVASCLRVFAAPADLDVVRGLLDDPRLPVRLNAAITLGRLGTEDDRALLTRTLADADWWVRYRSAHALAQLPSVAARDLHELALAHPDPFARDMLAQVIAEREIAW
ncbi:MAG: HEAT repeat domain-containing protein [Longimicrobiales bacterium]